MLSWSHNLWVSYVGAQISLWGRITGGREDGEGFQLAWYISTLGEEASPWFPLPCYISFPQVLKRLSLLFRLSAPWGQGHVGKSSFPRHLAQRLAHNKTSTNVCWTNEGEGVSIFHLQWEKKSRKIWFWQGAPKLWFSTRDSHLTTHQNDGLRGRFLDTPSLEILIQWVWAEFPGRIFLTNAQVILMQSVQTGVEYPLL